MNKLINSAFLLLTISLIALFSCNDPSSLGSDLLSGDQLDTEFTDTLTLRARTVPNDSLTVWGPGVNGVVFQNFAFGDFQDPVFGRTVSSIYAQVVTNASPPKFKKGTSVLDSVVLTLAYNADLSYGKIDEPFTIEVYEMSESLDAKKKYLASDSFSVKPTPIAVHTFVPNTKDSLTVMEINADTARSVRVPPQLRIRLDTAFAGPIFRLDSMTLANDTSFLQFFKGIWLKPASQNAGLLSFIMRGANTNLRFYYSDGNAKKSYDFRIFSGNPVVLHQRNYYGGSVVEDYISQPGENRNDSLLFMQGLNGVNIEFEIPYAESLKGLIINKAELILPIVVLPEDNSIYKPVRQVYATVKLTDTSSVILDDIFYATRSYPSSDFGDYFGGKVTSSNDYRLSISAHFQRMVSGDSGNTMRFTAHFRTERAARVVLGGPTHSAMPAKLLIRYTKY